ncbi:MAG: hypothetical protein JW862_16425 [Anaerolineales bacterium]|nr:hypothetical protein [Anaerolineales bacterium]
MKLRSLLLTLSLLLAAGCLSAAYLLAGYWQIIPILLLLALLWGFTCSRSRFWAASSLLIAFVILAAYGALNDLWLPLIILACTGALAAWDLLQFDPPAAGDALESQHLRALAGAIVAGLLLALFSASLNLHLSFGVIVILVLIAIGGIFYGIQAIIKPR